MLLERCPLCRADIVLRDMSTDRVQSLPRPGATTRSQSLLQVSTPVSSSDTIANSSMYLGLRTRSRSGSVSPSCNTVTVATPLATSSPASQRASRVQCGVVAAQPSCTATLMSPGASAAAASVTRQTAPVVSPTQQTPVSIILSPPAMFRSITSANQSSTPATHHTPIYSSSSIGLCSSIAVTSSNSQVRVSGSSPGYTASAKSLIGDTLPITDRTQVVAASTSSAHTRQSLRQSSNDHTQNSPSTRQSLPYHTPTHQSSLLQSIPSVVSKKFQSTTDNTS